MKLKKILAVALAATTALSSGVAYDALGAGTAKAANSGYFEKGDTITVTSGALEYVYTVEIPIIENGNDDDPWWVTTENAVYDRGDFKKLELKSGDFKGYPVTAGEVKLTSISWADGEQAHSKIEVPEYLSNSLDDALDDCSINSEIYANEYFDDEEGKFFVTGIDLAGGDDFEDIDSVDFSAAAKNLGSIKLSGFANLSLDDNSGEIPFGQVDKVDFEGTGSTLADIAWQTGIGVTSGSSTSVAIISDKLETLNVSGISELDSDGKDYTVAIDSDNLKDVNLSGDSAIKSLFVRTDRTKGLKLNITDVTNLTDLTVVGNAWVPTCDNPRNKGVDFVTDNGDGSKDLDLSSYGELKNVQINGCGLNSFVAPSLQENGTIDVSYNGIKEINLSSASEAKEVKVNNNKLTEIDVNALNGGKLTSLHLEDNFLTALDVSGLADLDKKPTIKMDGNFIAKANLTKADSGQSSVNASNQKKIDVNGLATASDRRGTDFAWAFTGDLGKAPSSNNKALMKNGGTGNLIVGVKVFGGPDGFAEKLANTVKFTEAVENGGAITLGEPTVVQAEELKYAPTNNLGNLSVVLVAVPVTGAADKTAGEKVTATIGGITKTINIGTDNVVLVSYDIASAISSENTKDKNKDNITQAPFYYPTEAFVLGNNGTVKVNANKDAYPNIKPKDSAKTWYNSDMDAYKMNGLKFTKWNTAVDGSGIAVNYNGKLNDVAADTVLYAQYTDVTYGIKYTKDTKKYFVKENDDLKSDTKIQVNGTTAAQNNVPFGETIALTANGFTTKNGGNFYGWYGIDSNKNFAGFYTDGQSDYGFAGSNYAADDTKKYSPVKSVTMYAVYGDDNHYISLENSSVTLTVGGITDGAYDVEDLKPSVTGYASSTKTRVDGSDKWNETEADLGMDKTQDFRYVSSDSGVVAVSGGFLVAKKKGTATVYVIDEHYGNVATVSVEVLGKGETKGESVTDKIKSLEAGEAVVADGGQTVKLNADGKTVTITKGKNQKTVKVNTVNIDGVTYKVTAIAAGAYKGMSKIQTVVIGNNVKTIGKIAFANCKNLKKVTMGKNITKIGVRCFKNDKKLAKVLIKSKKLTKTSTVGKNAFQKTKSGVKFYIAKKAATFKKVKKVLKAQGGAKKASYVKKYA